MAANLIGVILGGALEYNSMYFGFRALYLIATVLYMAAYLSSPLRRGSRTESMTEPHYSARRSSVLRGHQ
jgi:hypothetical protein